MVYVSSFPSNPKVPGQPLVLLILPFGRHSRIEIHPFILEYSFNLLPQPLKRAFGRSASPHDRIFGPLGELWRAQI
jgi:hypothetical protein